MLVLILLCIGVAHAQIQVNTTEGLVQGMLAPDGRNYLAFYGIPYAGAVDGKNRFKPPSPPTPFPGLFQATNRNIICAQPSERGFIGIENCLTVSIFTNNVTTPKPVIVWLNAEEYTTTTTANSFSFRRLVEEGVVVVSMKFRVSIFGFLCLRVPEAPGNAGLKDIIQGLEWVRNNIAAFGGNRDNVVLMGHGSAAALVDIITLSPLSANLVHKAVALSGSALAPWAVAYDPIGHAHLLADKLRYTKETNSALAFMFEVSGVNVLTTALNGFTQFFNNTPLFAPCLEDPTSNSAVLTDAPINIIRSGNYSQIPYIGSYVTREGTLRAEEAVYDAWLEKMQANFSNFMPADLDFGANLTETAQTINDFYFTGSPISMATIEDYLDYQGDILVLASVIRGARERAATSRSEVRLLEFAFMGTLNSDWTLSQVPLNGVKHGGILNYLFDFDLRPTEEHVMRSIVKRFTNFAYTGNPTNPPSSDWAAITPQTLYYFYYGGSANVNARDNTVYEETTKFNPHNIRMILWNQLYSQYYKAPPASSAGTLLSMFWTVVLGIVFARFV